MPGVVEMHRKQACRVELFTTLNANQCKNLLGFAKLILQVSRKLKSTLNLIIQKYEKVITLSLSLLICEFHQPYYVQGMGRGKSFTSGPEKRGLYVHAATYFEVP